MPVWLHINPRQGILTVEEERFVAAASVTAVGNWPPTGATVSLRYLTGAIEKTVGPSVQLVMGADAVFVPRATGHVRLGLLNFGDHVEEANPRAPAGRRVVESPEGLPLFRAA